MKKENCIVCERKKIVETEGRRIDGSWNEDKKLDKKYFGKWVCCYKCYRELIKRR